MGGKEEIQPARRMEAQHDQPPGGREMARGVFQAGEQLCLVVVVVTQDGQVAASAGSLRVFDEASLRQRITFLDFVECLDRLGGGRSEQIVAAVKVQGCTDVVRNT